MQAKASGAEHMTWPDHRRQMALLWLLCAAGGAFVLVQDILPVQPFWDLRLYDAAAAMARAGADPYAQGFGRSNLRFVYPPLVLKAFAALGPALVPALAAAYVACAGAFLALAPPGLRLAPVLIVGVFAFIHDPLTSGFATGNLSLYLHLMILALWLHAGRSGPRHALLAVIVLAACIKPSFAAYFGLWALRDLRLGR